MTNIPSRIGIFEVVRQLGSGGMGAVYLGRDPELNRYVAIKVIREEVHEQEALDRFFREARAAAALRHPNIITIYASGQHGHQPYMVMEFIEGESFADIIRHRKPIPLADKLSYLEQLCAGLQFAHRAGIVHRDIKPANVMIDRERMVRILDFGIARIEGSGLTQDGALIGSLNYMSPEQMLGRPLDHRSDIFSVGSVAYELISYRQAFKGNINDGLLHRLPHEDPPPLSMTTPGLPAGLEDVVMRALQKLPENRFQDLAEMRAAIAAFQSGTPGTDDLTDDRTLLISRPGVPGSAQPPSPITEVAAPMRSDTRFDFDNVKEEFPDFAISESQPKQEWAPADPQPAPVASAPPVPAPPIPAAPASAPPDAPDAASWTMRAIRVVPPDLASSSAGSAPTAPPPGPAAIQDNTVTKRPPSATAVRPPTGTSSRPPTATTAAQTSGRRLRRWIMAGGAVLLFAVAAAAAISYFNGPPPDPLEVERPGIEAAMERFRIGYRNRDMEAVLAAFPEIPADVRQAMQRTFDRCIVYDVSFDQLNISLVAGRADVAEVDVSSTHDCTPDSGAKQTTEMRREVYTLRKSGEVWVVNGVKPATPQAGV